MLVAIAAVSGASLAQSQNPAELQRLSLAWKQQAETDRSNALFRAKLLKIPTEYRFGTMGVAKLVRFEGTRPVYYQTRNLNSAKTIGANLVWPGGSAGYNLDGNGVTIAVWDGGSVRTTHQEFGGRATSMDGAGLDDHGNHVGGTMAASGVDPNAHGMAGGVTLLSWDWNNDTSEMAAQAAGNMRVSNHSYGIAPGWNWLGDWYWYGDVGISQTTDYMFGFYTNDMRQYDIIAYNAPNYLIVAACGNDHLDGPTTQPAGNYWNGSAWVPNTVVRDLDGGPTGYDAISSPAGAKNMLTVGAAEDIPGGYTGPASVKIADFSSWGPVDDGRIKPDIVANGVNVYSTGTASNTSYASMSGTSMASPAVAGASSLLYQRYRQTHSNADPKSATIRGLVIHTANEAGPNNGPDYTFGWGLMNIKGAADVISLDATKPNTIVEDTLVQGGSKSWNVTADGSGPIKVTICWTDPAGTVGPNALNNRTPKLVNDLDVPITKDGVDYLPWTLNPDNPGAAAQQGDNIRDNVEKIEIPAPSAGTYTIKVTHKGTLTNGTQGFSAIMTGVNEGSAGSAALSTHTINPTSVKGGVSATGTVTLTGNAPAGGIVVNLSSNNSKITVPATVTVLQGQSTANYPITTVPVVSTFTGKVTATYNSVSKEASLQVKAPALISLQLTPKSLIGGGTSVGRLFIDQAAPAPMSVSVSSNKPAQAIVPSVIGVPQGQTFVDFNINTVSVPVDTNALISCTRVGESSASNTLTILAPSALYAYVNSVAPTGVTLTGDHTRTYADDSNRLGIAPMNDRIKFMAVDLLGTSPVSNPSQLKVMIETNSSNLNVGYSITAYNYVKKQWTTVGSVAGGPTDIRSFFTIPSPAEHVNPGNRQLRMRATVVINGKITTWTGGIDAARWELRP